MAQSTRKVGPWPVLAAADGSTNQEQVVDVGLATSITLLFWWTDGDGSTSGEFKIDALRVDGTTRGGQDEWHPLSVSPAILVSGASGQADAVLSGDVRKIRVRYIRNAGSATVNCAYNATTRG